ncbi:MAG: cation transporter [Flavobacteriaceae bacterium]|jgi:mercuric ion binding protein|nr:cation transporter [Flavobacteriaceae bacterium]
MKKILIILLALPLGMVAQDNQKKNAKAEFTVKGNCEVCEKRIEKAALSIKGVKSAEWDIPSNKISLIYNPKKVTLEAIHTSIAAQGHDTSEAQAKKEDYDELPKCCQYDREEL